MPGHEPGKKFPAILPTSAPMARFSSQPSPLSPWSSWGLITLVGLALFFLRLGMPGLMDPDEGRYAEIAREMLLLGDWLIPRLNLVPYLEKPPLVYWLTSLSFIVFGLAEWAARLPAALAALAGLYLAYGLGSTLGGERQGLLGALVLATCGGYIILARLLTLDMVLSFFLNLAIALGYLALSRERPRLWPYAYLALSLAVLVKGPVALVLAGLIWGLAALLRGRQALAGLIRPGSWALLAGVVLPWFFLVARRYPEFPRFFLWEHHVERYVDGLAYHAEPWWYFGPVLLLLLLPWTGLLPWATGRRGAINTDDRRFLLIWAAVILVFFSLSRGKLVTYILPALLPLALLVGDGLAALPSREAGRRSPPGLRVSLLIWALLGWLLVALHAWPPKALAGLLHEAAFLEPYLLISLVLLAVIPSVTLILPNLKVLLVGALLFGALLPLGMERLALKRSPKELGLALKDQWQPGAALVGVNLYSQGLSFYSGHIFHLLKFRTELNFGERLVPDSGLFFQNFEELRTFAATRPWVFFYLKAKDVSWFKEKLPGEYEILGRQNDCVLALSPRK